MILMLIRLHMYILNYLVLNYFCNKISIIVSVIHIMEFRYKMSRKFVWQIFLGNLKKDVCKINYFLNLIYNYK